MYVLRRNITKIYPVYSCTVFHIISHPRRCRNISGSKVRVSCKLRCKNRFTDKPLSSFQLRCSVAVYFTHSLHNLKKPCPPRYPISLKGRRDGKAYCLFCSACVCDNQIRCQRVKMTLHALHRRIKGF